MALSAVLAALAEGWSGDNAVWLHPGPDWGWRLALDPSGPDSCARRLHNISPEGNAEFAVEMRRPRLACARSARAAPRGL